MNVVFNVRWFFSWGIFVTLLYISLQFFYKDWEHLNCPSVRLSVCLSACFLRFEFVSTLLSYWHVFHFSDLTVGSHHLFALLLSWELKSIKNVNII